VSTSYEMPLFMSHRDRYPPDANADEGTTNAERASWAEVGLRAYGKRTGLVGRKVGDDEDPFLIIVDLLADLAHWCDRNNVDMQSAIRSAARHYLAETGSVGRQLP
jgi:hypothetical protein